jgi:hypothetical protein
MRVTNLLLLLLGLVSVGAGVARAQTPAKPAAPSTTFDFLRSQPAEGVAIERFRMPFHQNFLPGFALPRNRATFTLNGVQPAPICYAMRTYKMTRVSPDSDVMEPAGYVKCEPSVKYSIRNADEGEKPPAP